MSGETTRGETRGAGRGSRSLVLVLAAAAVLLAGAVGAVIGYAAADRDTETATPVEAQAQAVLDSVDVFEERSEPARTGQTPPATTTTTAGGAEPPVGPRDLNRDELDIEQRLQSGGLSCETLRGREDYAGANAALGCVDDSGNAALYLVGSVFSSNPNGIYDEMLAKGGITKGGGACTGEFPAEQEWIVEELPRGRVACFEKEGRGTLFWFDTPLRLIGFAFTPEGGSPASLFEWWSTRAGPKLFDEESALLEAVPDAHRETCRLDLLGGDAAGVPRDQARCTAFVGDPAVSENEISVDYSSHPDAEQLYHWYDEVRHWYQSHNVGRDIGNCPDAVPSEQPFTRAGAAAGRLACNPPGVGLSDLVWTSDSQKILGDAGFIADVERSKLAELHEWWRTRAGPVSPSGG